MGKMKNKKSGGSNHPNPVGLPSLKSLEKEEEGNPPGTETDYNGSSFVHTILELIKSHLVEERDSALNSLSIACQTPKYLGEIFKSDVIKTIGPLLIDPSPSVRNSAAGALRNLSCVSAECCEFMVKQDIMTPVLSLLQQKYTSWTPNIPQQVEDGKEKSLSRIDSPRQTFIEVINLMWNLCENSTVALQIFNRERVGDFLCQHLNSEVYGVNVAVAVAQCLYTASEDNKEAFSKTSDVETILSKILLSFKDQVGPEALEVLYLKTLAIGILLNIKSWDLSSIQPEVVETVINILSTALDVDHISLVNKLSSDLPLETKKKDRKDVIHSHRSEDDAEFQKSLLLEKESYKIVNLLQCQILVLEILSNILSDEESSEYDDGSDESVKSFQDEEMEETDDVHMEDLRPHIPSEVYGQLVSSSMLSKVLHKVKEIPVNVNQILLENKEHGQNVVKYLIRHKCTALLCLQNIIEGIQVSDVEKDIKLSEVWAGLGGILLGADPTMLDIIEAVTSAMRAIIHAWNSCKDLQISSQMFSDAFNIFYDAYRKVETQKVRINIIKIVGGMSLLIMKLDKQSQTVAPILTQVSSFLMSLLPSKIEKDSLWVVAEVLDTIFDVFAEDDYNQVLTEIKLIPKLSMLQPQFKKQVRNERRSLGEHKAVIDTANTNLPRFIQYKTQHGVS